MAYKHTADSSGGYMDNVRVKISEKYKPPPRIVLAMSYSQRLSLNKQIQDTIPNYEFLLEKTVIEKMKEWRNARSVMFQQLNNRIEKSRRDEMEKSKANEKIDFSNHYQDKQQQEIELDSTVASMAAHQTINQPIYSATSQPILIPTQANSYSNILTPIPLKEQSLNQNYQSNVDKSPFNISDFEADTSSPFDNMELKSINDMEELAQVLKVDHPPLPVPQANIPPSNYAMLGAATNYYPIPSSYGHAVTSTSSHYSNGYYYNSPETIQAKQSFNSTSSSAAASTCTYNANHIIENKSMLNHDDDKPTYNSVPHIIKSLQIELDNTHLDNMKQQRDNQQQQQTFTSRTNNRKCDDFDFSSLPKNLQDMSKAISLMGFPLSRVSRVCKVVGNDQKKIVDHLLAMSELLDLGFPENKVSTALLQCDNDRDKALDILIS